MLDNKLKDIKSYVVFYGNDNEDKLMDYDLLILEPKGHTQKSISALKLSGKIVVAYLSIVEISRSDEFFNLLNDDDFVYVNDKRIENLEYQTINMDISSDKVQNILIYKAETLLNKGYDGVFLDTIGNIEYINVHSSYKEKLLIAAEIILGQIKTLFTDAIIIQNNGLEMVFEYTAKYLNAICLENPPCKTIKNLMWTYNILKRLDKLKKEYSLQVLLLQENNSNRIINFILRSIAIKKGYIFYMAKKYFK